jgi:hypothetical protein
MFVFVPSFVSLQVSFLDFVRVVVPQAPAVSARWLRAGKRRDRGSVESILQLMSCRAIAVVSLTAPGSRSETIVMLK